MSDVFTDSVLQLMTGGQASDRGSYDELREHLRGPLVGELRRRGLWEAPPTHVGVQGSSWHEPGTFEELLGDAYTFIFVDRLRGLANQARVRDSIRGLVIRNLRNFLTERQRKADPLGYRIYRRLRAAIERLIERGRLFLRGRGWGLGTARSGSQGDDKVESQASKVDNRSVLAFSERLTPVAGIDALEGPASEWNNRLMPELVTAERRAVPKVVEQLSGEVETLPEHGVEAFGFQHLTKALKDDARKRWLALWQGLDPTAPEDGAPGAPQVPVVEPDATPDWLQFQAVVLECVERQIDAIPQPKRQRDLWTVWLFLRSTRIDTEEPEPLLSDSETSRLLGLSRGRVAQMKDELMRMVRRCLDCPGCALPFEDSTTAGTPDETRASGE